MGRWAADFRGEDGILQKLQETATKINGFEVKSFEGDESKEEFFRFEKTLRHIQHVVDRLDPDLIALDSTAKIKNSVTEACNNIDSLEDSPENIDYLINANDALDVVLTEVNKSFVFYGKKMSRSLANILDTYEKTLNADLENCKTSCEVAIEDTNATITKLNQTIKGKQDEIQTITTKLTELDDETEEKLDSFDKKFLEMEAERKTKFDNFLKIQTNQAYTTVAAIQKIKDEDAENILSQMKNLLEKVSKVYDVTQDSTQAGAHGKYAKEEKFSANLLMSIGVIYLVVIIGLMIAPEIWQWWTEPQSGIKWTNILSRLPLSIFASLPAVYLLSLSAMHRRNEFTNKRREVRLLTLNPYTELWDKEERQLFREEVGRDIFLDRFSTENTESESNALTDTLKSATSADGT